VKKTIVITLALLAAVSSSAQNAENGETGQPFVTHYLPNTYGGSTQVFSIAQDRRGVLYFGLGSGLIEFDGVQPRGIPTPGNTIIRTMTTDPTQRVYVGTVDDFGYLAVNAAGEVKYVSLIEFVPKEERGFQDVYSMRWTPEGLYIQAPERLIRLTPEEAPTVERAPGKWRVKVWRPATRLSPLSYVFGSVYTLQTGTGLMRVAGDSLELAPGGAEFAKDRAVRLEEFSGKSLDDGQALVFRRGRGFSLMSRGGLKPFATQADALTEKLGVSNLAMLRDGTLGMAMSTGGFAKVGRDGRLIFYLDRASGALPSDGALSVFTGRDGVVWLGMQKGMAKIETPSAFSRFGESAGLSGFVNDMVRFHGTLFAATMQGVFYLDAKASRFQLVPGMPKASASSVFSLLRVGDRLLAPGFAAGIFEVSTSGMKMVAPRPENSGVMFAMYQSPFDPSLIYVGCDNMLVSYRVAPSGAITFERKIADTPAIRSIAESPAGTIWLGLESQGVMRVRRNGDQVEAKQFGTVDGLAGEGGGSIHQVDGRLLFAVRGGVHAFDEGTGRFIPAPQFQVAAFGGNPEEYGIVEDSNRNVAVNLGQETVLLRRQNDGRYSADRNILRRIANLDVTKTYTDEGGVVWFGEADGVVRFDPRLLSESRTEYPALIRRVAAGDGVLLYGGGGAGPAQAAKPLAWGQNALRFEFAATSYFDLTANQYQSKLEGFDNDWSAWSDESRRDYTNLPPGDFRFRVRARDLFQNPSSEAEYSFTILPPWYRTWWAYALYALLLLGLGLVVDRMQRRRLMSKERERALLREAELRAETSAAQALALRAENDRKRNVELLSEIGKDLTSTLELDTIFYRLYEHVNQLMDASVFGVGLYRESRQQIDFRLAMEKGKRYAPYARDTRDKNQLPVWCIENRQPVFINDIAAEYSKYISEYRDLRGKLEDGSVSQSPNSLIYLPLIMKDRVLGIITVQSFEKNAYTPYHLDLLENLAAYTSIALDNADAYRRLNSTLENLKSAQEQLVVQEKLASLGALTAGIAHEIKNPLNFVNNFSELSVELNQELREELDKYRGAVGEDDYANITGLLTDLEKNARKINEHGKRADSIVRSMLLHSRGQRGERQFTDLNTMLEEYLNLSYHGMRAQDSSFNATIERAFDKGLRPVEVVPQDLSRVFLNILNNACYAVSEKSRKLGTASGYAPTLRVTTADLGDWVEIRIGDNGLGIPAEVREQIFHPFFTTKPTGQGTGLGLSISHEIVVQEHAGQLDVETEPGQYTEFIVRLPMQLKEQVK
jgi:signal transduction histidine kinase/ligand-binding sensor domain-containing protein